MIGEIHLASIWNGAKALPTLDFNLRNESAAPLAGFTLCLTGTLWLIDPSRIQGGAVVKTISNFIEIRPNLEVIESGGVWTFSLYSLNDWPRHTGDGVQSAYLAFDGGGFATVAVQPLARIDDAQRPDMEGGAALGPAPAEPRRPLMTISVIPFPNVASVAVARLPEIRAIFEPAADMTAPHRSIYLAVAALAGRVAPGGDQPFARPGERGSRGVSLRPVAKSRLGQEGYSIAFEGAEIIVSAETDAGFAYGLITLAQMAIGARDQPERFGFPTRGVITDRPRFGWRGVMVDVARTFYSVRELKALTDLFAWLKLNLLHLHLNDDEGWRIDVDGYPQVAEHAAMRGHGLRVPPLLGSSFLPYGGHYSPTDIADLESHAAALSIRLMPEIDVPGHAHALLEALPRLRELGDTGGYNSIQGFFANTLNPCLPETYRFLGAAFDTAVKRFAGSYVHIGGDEVRASTWSRSPKALKAAAEQGLATTGELQRSIFDWVHARLAKQGRTVVVWEDALNHSILDPASTVAVVWQHPDRAREPARRGYGVVLAPANAYYLDMASTDNWRAAGGHWAGVVPLERTYDFEAEVGWPNELLGRLLGVHACIWGEYMHDRRNFDALVFPRIFAFAERAWIDRSAKDYGGFLLRANASTARLDRARLSA